MTALKAKWTEMSRYRRVLLIVMAIEILAFFFATLVMINRPGLEYQDALLYPGTEGDFQIYQGTVDGETDRKSTRLNSSHTDISRMPSSA